MIFNEDKLQEEIIKTWGEFGVHNEVFKAMRKQISDLKQLSLNDVSQQRELLLAYEEFTSYKVLGKRTPRISKQMVEDFLANNNVTKNK